ncbi:MAG: hypothetical protein GX927_03125 [Lentisphaerae bacterium]|nr:hypothetical protein [Lentisphaerota bacterium]
MKKDERFCVWGYILDKVPGKAMFVNGLTQCSLETAVDYLGCGCAFWMNPLHDLDALNENQLNRLDGIPSIICGLTHIETNGPGLGGWELFYKEAAARVSELSLKYPAIKGALIDDFRSETGPSRDITPAELHEINAALKSKNPALKLYIVQYYTLQNPADLLPYRDDFDGISVWNWVPTDYFWDALYADELRRLREMFPDKVLNQGQFMHDFGGGNRPMPMKYLRLQCSKILSQLEAGTLDGWCVIQSGYFCREYHRRQAEYLRNFWNWIRQTRTIL